MRRFSILVIFFITGASALIYQVAWVRQATLVFGVSVYAYSSVLAAFMGGTALGSYFLGKRADDWGLPLRMYALLQVGIALFGLLSPFVLTGLMPIYADIARSLSPGSGTLIFIRTFFSILVLVPPTFLMGATLPVMARALATQSGQVASDVGQLYAVDTLGAALGCGLSGLFLLRTLGTRETIFLAVVLNLLAALLTWMLHRHSDTYPRQAQNVQTEPELENRPSETGGQRVVLWAYLLSGFAALGLEVAWARILAIFTLDAVFSFSIMLTTFLTGLTMGGWLSTRWIRKRADRGQPAVAITHFSYLQIGVGLTALLTLFIFARLSGLNLEEIFGAYSLTNVIYYEFLLGFVTLFVPTVLLGALFPIVVSLYTAESNRQIGRRIGKLNALNTIGAVAGSLVAGFLLIPALGLQGTVGVLAGLNLIVGMVTSWIGHFQTGHSRFIPQAGLSIGIALVILLPDGYYLGFREGPSEHMVFYEEGVEATVAVFDVPEQNFKVSFVNGRIEVPTDEISMKAFWMLGHLPPLLKPDAERALMLSFGNGIATGALDTHQIAHIDAVDLSAEQFEAAELYWEENYNVLRSPRLNTYVEDGRNFLLQTPYTYDIITTDATHPVNTSSWALFTQEFYESVASRLTNDGVFMQWMPFHNLLESDYKTILRTFQHIFPHATLWYTGGSHTLLVATPQPLTHELLMERLNHAMDHQIIHDTLGPPSMIQLFLAMDEETLRTYVGSGKLSTDNHAYFLPRDEDTQRIMQRVISDQ